MIWAIKVEESPDKFVDAKERPFDDGFAKDGSEWGDAESGVVQAHLATLKASDPKSRSYAATAVS